MPNATAITNSMDLDKLAQDTDDVETMVAIVNNPAVWPDTLAVVALKAPASVRAMVAMMPMAPPYILAWLARDPNLDVLACVACNPSTPSSVLRHLTQSADSRITHCALDNIKVTHEAATDAAAVITRWHAEYVPRGWTRFADLAELVGQYRGEEEAGTPIRFVFPDGSSLVTDRTSVQPVAV